MLSYKDQLGNNIQLKATPKRIISLVPSQTELLYDLGLNKEVIGITKFCVHPESWFRTKTRVGGTKQINSDKVKELQPDLLIANKEENIKEQIEQLQEIAPVWVSDVNNLEDALQMILSVGEFVNRSQEAEQLIKDIEAGFKALSFGESLSGVAYLIWKDPYITIGGDTFINDMMKRCGFNNAFGHKQRYPEVNIEELTKCDLILLSSEPYPFKQKHIDELQSLLPNSKIILTDGEMFSWYGSRLKLAPVYFQQLIKQLNIY
jgi:ABC-type Fe3+-hydroxamate transport system substrate-binding protein